jgi:hypothetical protein
MEFLRLQRALQQELKKLYSLRISPEPI